MSKPLALTLAVSLAAGLMRPTGRSGRVRIGTRISKETGLLKEWPSGGPRVVWTANDLGTGYGSMAVAGDRVFVQGARGNEQRRHRAQSSRRQGSVVEGARPGRNEACGRPGRGTARHADRRRRSPVRAHRERRSGVPEDRRHAGVAAQHPQGVRRLAAAMADQRVAARRRTASRGDSRRSGRRHGQAGQDDGQDRLDVQGAERYGGYSSDHRRGRAGRAHLHDVHRERPASASARRTAS